MITLEMEKRELWTNAAKHFCGDHSKCPPHRECETWSLAENPKSVELLEIFLRRTLFIVETCAEDNTTQANESLHRLKLKYASKDVKWGFTWEARMMCAVLDRNEVGWKLQLYNRLGLPPLSEENYERLMKLEQARIARKLWVHSDRYRGWQLEERKKREREGKILATRRWLENRYGSTPIRALIKLRLIFPYSFGMEEMVEEDIAHIVTVGDLYRYMQERLEL